MDKKVRMTNRAATKQGVWLYDGLTNKFSASHRYSATYLYSASVQAYVTRNIATPPSPDVNRNFRAAFKFQSYILTSNKNLHLTISTIIITIISLTYGLFPNIILPHLFDFKVESTDLKQVFRASMGLYSGMAILWVTGIFKPLHWRTATISNVFFMVGLAAGRIFSLIIDGIPSISFSIGLALELTLAFWGIKNLNKYQAS